MVVQQALAIISTTYSFGVISARMIELFGTLSTIALGAAVPLAWLTFQYYAAAVVTTLVSATYPTGCGSRLLTRLGTILGEATHSETILLCKVHLAALWITTTTMQLKQTRRRCWLSTQTVYETRFAPTSTRSTVRALALRT